MRRAVKSMVEVCFWIDLVGSDGAVDRRLRVARGDGSRCADEAKDGEAATVFFLLFWFRLRFSSAKSLERVVWYVLVCRCPCVVVTSATSGGRLKI